MSAAISPIPNVELEECILAGFEPIHPAALKRLGRWDIDLFFPGKPGGPPLLLRDSVLDVDAERIAQLVATSGRQVLVRTADFQALSKTLLEQVEDIPKDSSLPWTDRYALLQTAAAAEIIPGAKPANPERIAKFSDRMGSLFVTLIRSADVDLAGVFHVARHDHHTFTHVTNVCCYSLILAGAVGITNKRDLNELAIGALMHDVGKRKIPAEILRKLGPLTAQERRIVQRHPLYGYEELVSHGGFTLTQLLIAYQHHERVDGGGYPVGVMGEEIHPWAKLISVVDVFDALTGKRPYRKPATPQVAMEFIRDNAGTHFDEEMVRCWTQAMPSP